MRNVLLAIVLLFVPVLASASEEATLLAPDGTFYAIESRSSVGTEDSTTVGNSSLVLTWRRGTEITTQAIPATLSSGAHIDPMMAYDAESDLLFVFWLHQQSLAGSELLFVARNADGEWTEPTRFGGRFFAECQNLRIAVTRKYLDEATGETASGLTAHAAWWEWDTHSGEWFAQYQMLTIVNGAVAEEPAPVDLRELARANSVRATEPVDANTLRHPLLFTSPKQDSVVVIFGDMTTQKIHEVRVQPMKPAAQGRLRVPVGRHEGGATAPTLKAASNGQINGVYGGDAKKLAFYTIDKDALHYVVMQNGSWTAAKSITLDSQVPASAAVDALRRMVSDH
jgi:hypothetical protein